MPIQIPNQSFIPTVNTYINNSQTNTYTRFAAYDICHKQFVTALQNNNFDYDNLALHLYSFLASYGMVCRQSVLLQHNYTFLIDVVKIVCDKKYVSLLDIDIFAPTFQGNNYFSLVMALKSDIIETLGISKSTADTLTSKVMLATLGCVPGYDKNIKSSLKTLGLCRSFTKTGLQDLLSFAFANKNNILQLRAQHKTLNYSDMKFLDCYLW